MAMVFCRGCGKEIHDSATACPHCGANQLRSRAKIGGVSNKDYWAAGLLCFFLGIFGAHRFYVGKVGSGIAQLLTLGGLGIWTFCDLMMILTNNFEDIDGSKILHSK
jgi:ribosomal protein L40E